LLERHGTEVVTRPRVEMEHDVRRARCRVDVDARVHELRLGVAALPGELGPAALQPLVGAMIERRTNLKRRAREHRGECGVVLRLALETDAERADTDGLARVDLEHGAPALGRPLELAL